MEQRLPVAAAAGAAFARRAAPGRLLADDAPRLAQACHDMAVRFHRGGKLLVFGNGGPSTDAQHIAVEFIHPVIVGKRALPAIALTNDVATTTGVARAGDIALGISADGRCANVLRGLEVAHQLGLFTVALTGGDGGPIAASPAVDHAIVARCDDPRIIKEIHTTAYHVLWELVHVFFEQPGLLGPGVVR